MCVRSYSLVITVHGIFWVFSTWGGWSPSYLTVHCSDPCLFDEILITAQFRAATRLLYLIEVKCHNWLTLTCPLYLHTTKRLIPSGLEGCITVGCNHFQTAAKWTKLSRLLHIVLLLRGSFALFAVFAQFWYLQCLPGSLLFKHICSSYISDLFYLFFSFFFCEQLLSEIVKTLFKEHFKKVKTGQALKWLFCKGSQAKVACLFACFSSLFIGIP